MNTKLELTALPAGILGVLFASIAGQTQAVDTFKEMFAQGKRPYPSNTLYPTYTS